MAIVYFYIPAEKLEDVVDCGLKLSEWKSRYQDTPWNGSKPCLTALLHPRDDPKFSDPAFQCIKLNVDVENCIVADHDLYSLSLSNPDIKKAYIGTMTPLRNYLFGSFRKPECLIFTTVLSESISILGKGLDEPILYESSEALYVNNLVEQFQERYHEMNRVLLYSFLTLQEQSGLIQGYRSSDGKLTLFRSKDRYITVPVPDLTGYRMDCLQEKAFGNPGKVSGI